MSSKFKTTVLWEDSSRSHFLCRVLNIGRSTDELKIIVSEPDSPTGAMYTEGKGRFTGTEIARLQGEVSYHSDGTLLLKLPAYSPRTSTEHRNPSGVGTRRVPLSQISDWEPFVRYTVIRPIAYDRARTDTTVVARAETIFDGTPFECVFFLGAGTLNDPADAAAVVFLRIRGVARGLDLLLRFESSAYRGEVMRLTNSGKPVFMANNVIEVVEHRSVWGPIVSTTWRSPGSA
jgi:hypothetical protein